MKNFNRRMAAREGFTLVELIVVIAILAILAAVAYPAYTGYITKAKDAADITNLDGIKTAAEATAATLGGLQKIVVTADDGKISKIEVTLDDETTKKVLYSTGNDADETLSLTFKQLLGTIPSLNATGTYKSGATWDETKTDVAQRWAAN